MTKKFIHLLWACAAMGSLSAWAQGTGDLERPDDPGWRIINSLSHGNCASCHALPGQVRIPSTFGPSLEGVGRRHDVQALRQWVTDPRVLRPGTLMPAFGTVEGLSRPSPKRPVLSAQEIDWVVSTLQSWR